MSPPPSGSRCPLASPTVLLQVGSQSLSALESKYQNNLFSQVHLRETSYEQTSQQSCSTDGHAKASVQANSCLRTSPLGNHYVSMNTRPRMFPPLHFHEHPSQGPPLYFPKHQAQGPPLYFPKHQAQGPPLYFPKHQAQGPPVFPQTPGPRTTPIFPQNTRPKDHLYFPKHQAQGPSVFETFPFTIRFPQTADPWITTF